MPFEVVAKQIKNTRDEILAELHESIKKNNVIGILIKETKELITTAVIDIEEDPSGEVLIILMEQDLHGYPISKNPLLLSSIERVIHFNLSFDDPQYVKVRRKEKFRV
jgi:hypothetical protein